MWASSRRMFNWPDCPPKFSDWTTEARAGTGMLCWKLLMDAVLGAVIEGHCAAGNDGSRTKAHDGQTMLSLNEDIQQPERVAFC